VKAVAGGSAKPVCRWCRGEIPPTARKDAKTCGRKCRQTVWRLRRRSSTGDASPAAAVADARPMIFAYADPPYPGTSKRYYGKEPTYGGEVDHALLIQNLVTGAFDGWALSTSAKALRDILPLCPPEARVCAWMKPHGVPPATYGLHNVWEVPIVVQGRKLRPGHPDALRALPARKGGTLPGRKPLAFCAWLFQCLGMLPGDELHDLYPGTGVLSKAWRVLGAESWTGIREMAL